MERTYLEPEEFAYNTRGGGHSRSNRGARAICPDGIIRTFTAGIPDTYFSIPAHGRIKGRYVVGSLTIDSEDEELHFREVRPVASTNESRVI